MIEQWQVPALASCPPAHEGCGWKCSPATRHRGRGSAARRARCSTYRPGSRRIRRCAARDNPLGVAGLACLSVVAGCLVSAHLRNCVPSLHVARIMPTGRRFRAAQSRFPDCLDRIDSRCLRRRVEPEEQPDARRGQRWGARFRISAVSRTWAAPAIRRAASGSSVDGRREAATARTGTVA